MNQTKSEFSFSNILLLLFFNLIQIAGVLFLGWSAASIILVSVIESIGVALINFFRMLYLSKNEQGFFDKYSLAFILLFFYCGANAYLGAALLFACNPNIKSISVDSAPIQSETAMHIRYETLFQDLVPLISMVWFPILMILGAQLWQFLYQEMPRLKNSTARVRDLLLYPAPRLIILNLIAWPAVSLIRLYGHSTINTMIILVGTLVIKTSVDFLERYYKESLEYHISNLITRNRKHE